MAITRHVRLTRKTAPRKRNPERRERRRRENQRYYHSAHWRRARLATFEHDGWRCTCTIVVSAETFNDGQQSWAVGDVVRCPYVDYTRTGAGLVCDEVHYTHRGREIPGKDTRTRCLSCDRRRTPLERANWKSDTQQRLH